MRAFKIFVLYSILLAPLVGFSQISDATIDSQIGSGTFSPTRTATTFKAVNNKFFGLSASGTNTYSITVSSTITSYITNEFFVVNFINPNSGASTLNITPLGGSPLGAITIKKLVSGSLVDVAATDLTGTQVLIYNGTYFQLGGAQGTGGTVTSVNVTTANGVSATGGPITGSGSLTFSLGNITPTTVNGITFSGSSSPALSVTGSSSISGANTGDQTNVTGTAGSLSPGANINGVLFTGVSPITVTAAAGTLTGTTLNSSVVTSSLTSVGTLTNLTVTNPITGSITGNAATVTTNANLTGAVTSSGNATLLGFFSSSNLRGALSDELGTGAALFDGATPTGLILTNATGLPISTGLTGGTTNRIPYFISSTALGTASTFLFDGTNFGIGATPQSVFTASLQTSIQAPVSSSLAQFVGLDANPLRITFDTHNNVSASGTAFMIRRSRGTAASPSAVSAGDVIAAFSGRAYGTSQYAAASTGLINIKANQTFTNANNGTYISFDVTPDNSVTAVEALRIKGDKTLTATGYTTNGGLLYTNGTGDVSQTGAGTSTTLLHGGTTPSYSAVSLTSDVSGLLPYANFSNGAALSVVGRSANTSGVQADITAATDGNILRRSGTSIGFGSLDLTAAGTVGSTILGLANGGTGSATKNFVDISTNQTGIAGNKTWTGIHIFTPNATDGSLNVGSVTADPSAATNGSIWYRSDLATTLPLRFELNGVVRAALYTSTSGLASANAVVLAGASSSGLAVSSGNFSYTGNGISVTTTAASSGSGKAIWTSAGANHTGLSASTEEPDFTHSGGSIQLATGALTTQRMFWIKPQTIGFVGASTVADIYSFSISGALPSNSGNPQAGTNATFTRAWAMGISGEVNITGSVLYGPAATSLTASTKIDQRGLGATASTINHRWADSGNTLLGTVTDDGTLKINHIGGNTSAPTIAAGVGAGTTPTVVVTNATDISGIVDVTTGSIPTGANSVIATITFNKPFATAPNIQLAPNNANAAGLAAALTMVYVTSTTTTFVITSGTTALTAATQYKWFYSILQ